MPRSNPRACHCPELGGGEALVGAGVGVSPPGWLNGGSGSVRGRRSSERSWAPACAEAPQTHTADHLDAGARTEGATGAAVPFAPSSTQQIRAPGVPDSRRFGRRSGRPAEAHGRHTKEAGHRLAMACFNLCLTPGKGPVEWRGPVILAHHRPEGEREDLKEALSAMNGSQHSSPLPSNLGLELVEPRTR